MLIEVTVFDSDRGVFHVLTDFVTIDDELIVAGTFIFVKKLVIAIIVTGYGCLDTLS
ncbi:hypothetical protein D3C87_1365810 [compost metagenome]